MNDKFLPAMLLFSDGKVGFDCKKLADIPVDGISLKNFDNHVIIVQTRNTKYVFTSQQGRVRGQAYKEDGSIPRFLHRPEVVHIHGSTYGGSMIKLGFIGVDMHLEFSTKDMNNITTTAIQSVQYAPIEPAVLPVRQPLMPHQEKAIDDMLSNEGFAV